MQRMSARYDCRRYHPFFPFADAKVLLCANENKYVWYQFSYKNEKIGFTGCPACEQKV